jgi:hypothetical protein
MAERRKPKAERSDALGTEPNEPSPQRRVLRNSGQLYVLEEFVPKKWMFWFKADELLFLR